MKSILLIAYCLLIFYFAKAQEKESTQTLLEQQLENGTEQEVTDTDDDEYGQQLEYFKKHPLNLNAATEEELRFMHLLSELQIINFIRYKNLLGQLIDIYELQSIPGWDIVTIRKLLPFITVKEYKSITQAFKQRFRNGDNVLLLRYGRIIEKSNGYQQPVTGNNYYLGNPDRLQLRYKYQYKNLLQLGFTADKDAGESFFRNKQKAGFDFYSMHLFARNLGTIKSIAIGDYTINMGQGLLQWQGMAFRKSVAVLNIKRQGPVLRPYSSAGEFNFHRGVGINWQYRKWEIVVFGSSRKLSANTKLDSSLSTEYVSSLLSTGYHRTASEAEDRNRLQMLAYGGTIRHLWLNGRLAFNTVRYKFSKPIIKEALPYNLFAFSGDQWSNTSVDYDFTFKNIHVFGEVAIDNNKNFAVLNGLLASIDPKVDITLLHRSLNKAYQSFFSNAFTENTVPSNENGLFAGISIRPKQNISIEAYLDIYRFPWLKARINEPAQGSEYLVQINYTVSRKLELNTKYRRALQPVNNPDNIGLADGVIETVKHNWRIQLNYTVNKIWSLRSRVELLWLEKSSDQLGEQGYLGYADIVYRPAVGFWGANLRLQYYETDGFDSRLFAFENDLLFSYVFPSFYNKGFRCYINGRIDFKQVLHLQTSFNITMWTKIAQTIVPNANSIGSGLDLTCGKTRTDIKFQFFLGW